MKKMKTQLEFRYAKHPQRNRRFSAKEDDIYIGGSDGEHQPVLKIYHDDDAEAQQADAERGLEGLATAALEF